MRIPKKTRVRVQCWSECLSPKFVGFFTSDVHKNNDNIQHSVIFRDSNERFMIFLLFNDCKFILRQSCSDRPSSHFDCGNIMPSIRSNAEFCCTYGDHSSLEISLNKSGLSTPPRILVSVYRWYPGLIVWHIGKFWTNRIQYKAMLFWPVSVNRNSSYSSWSSWVASNPLYR